MYNEPIGIFLMNIGSALMAIGSIILIATVGITAFLAYLDIS